MAGLATVAATRLGVASEPVPAKGGSVKQSIAHWCFGSSAWKWTLEKTCEVARELGCGSVELLQPAQLETLRPFGLTCAMVSINVKRGPGFVHGWNNPANWAMLEETTRTSIDAAAAFGAPNVIAFNGMKARNPDRPEEGEWSAEEGAANCVEGLKKVAGYAEEKGVTICLEMLNSRDGTGRMLGHPGYQGDHVEYCTGILDRIASPRVKLLFDIYHVQIMDGDLIRRIRQHVGSIGHIHTAGVPGRGELGAGQEVNYPAVIQALVGAGYQGFVGHEFLPTRDPMEGLREAVELCRG
jgi:hydroxypyruvate isomerase